MKESIIQKKILNFLKSKNIYAVKVISANRSGVPDILACYKGKFIGLEVKTADTKNRVSELQKYNLDLIEKNNGISAVVWNVEQVQTILNKV